MTLEPAPAPAPTPKRRLPRAVSEAGGRATAAKAARRWEAVAVLVAAGWTETEAAEVVGLSAATVARERRRRRARNGVEAHDVTGAAPTP